VLAKHWPGVPIHDDVRTLKGSDIAGSIDVICGGFPCQDISLANSGAMVGLSGKKSGLWSEFNRQIREHSPTFVIVENSPVLRSRGLGEILRELSALGYDAEWHCIPATAVDAPHSRDRIWIISYPAGLGDWLPEGQVLTRRHFVEHVSERPPEPDVRRVADGVPNQPHRLAALGNAVVPQIPEMIGLAILEAWTASRRPQ
jgi:DNA (cytosine-5)-methyltransferase 1